jgi:hypothetical protein
VKVALHNVVASGFKGNCINFPSSFIIK